MHHIKLERYRFLFLVFFIQLTATTAFSQVGIGTTTPNTKAALDVRATDKGVLFPRLTTAQRNAITSPPDGLHIFNTNERCINYYDSTYQLWNCYCSHCETVIIDIISNMCRVNFYDQYARLSPSKKYLIRIATGVVISGCNSNDTALSFSSMPFNAVITIQNNGTIAGAGGDGGMGAIESGCAPSIGSAQPGKQGGYAISTKAGVQIIVNNTGIIAGGGGGGGGATRNPGGEGGGGGGGAGIPGGTGGGGGGAYAFSGGPINICTIIIRGQPGATGQATIGGTGGTGNNGGGTGGNGGTRGLNGQTGAGSFGVVGGAPGKAIGGGSGNILTNAGGGISFGAVD